MKVLSFDIESNGLHGQAFSVGAVLIDSDNHKVIDEYTSRCPIVGEVDEWVQANVLPSMKDVPEDCKDTPELRKKFWVWYKEAKAKSDLIVCSNPYPVETRFLAACQDDDLKERYWDHPFPLLDLGTMLYTIGAKTPSERGEYIGKAVKDENSLVHNPRWDAWATAMTACKVLGL